MKLGTSNQWPLLERFSRSEVKDQDHSETKCTFVSEHTIRLSGLTFTFTLGIDSMLYAVQR